MDRAPGEITAYFPVGYPRGPAFGRSLKLTGSILNGSAGPSGEPQDVVNKIIPDDVTKHIPAFCPAGSLRSFEIIPDDFVSNPRPLGS